MFRIALDSEAIGRGAMGAAAIAVPAALAGLWLSRGDGDSSTFLALASVAMVLFGFGRGGYIAGMRRTGTPLVHGALAAGVAFAVIQTIGTMRRLLIGDEVSVIGIGFTALIAVSCGALGGYAASTVDRRRRLANKRNNGSGLNDTGLNDTEVPA